MCIWGKKNLNKIIYKGEQGYEEAVFSRVLNHRRPDRKSILIAFPENESDAIELIKFAKENKAMSKKWFCQLIKSQF